MRSLRGIVLALIFAHLCGAQQRFPKWQEAHIGLYGTWQQATLIVIGDLQEGVLIGESDPPAFAAEDVRRVYWCEGVLQIESIIRGTAPATRKYLWGTLEPGCKPERLPGGQNPYPNPVMRIWFLRTEDGYLRPIVDGGGIHLLIFRGQWSSTPQENPEWRVARLLLSPAADSLNPKDYVSHFGQSVSNACYILGFANCKAEVQLLSRDHNTLISNAACEYLRSEFGEACPLKGRRPPKQ